MFDCDDFLVFSFSCGCLWAKFPDEEKFIDHQIAKH